MRTCTENFKINKWIKCPDNFWKAGKFKKGERAWESNKRGAKMRTFMESSDNQIEILLEVRSFGEGLFYTVTSEGSSQVKECTSDPKEGAVALRNCLTGLRGGGGWASLGLCGRDTETC